MNAPRYLWCSLILIAALGMSGVATAQAPASKSASVDVHVLVVEADKASNTFDPRLGSIRKAIIGYSGAKILDELKTNLQKDAAVRLDIMNRSRTLSIRLLEVKPDHSVRLRVGISALKFSTETTHKKGGTLVVRAPHPSGSLSGRALFLAITPRAP